MIDELLKNKYGGRFVQGLTTFTNSFIPTYSIFDRYTGETFQIKIDSFAADHEMVIENILYEKVINFRDKKIDSIIDGTKA
jgi:hypothetical protein